MLLGDISSTTSVLLISILVPFSLLTKQDGVVSYPDVIGSDDVNNVGGVAEGKRRLQRQESELREMGAGWNVQVRWWDIPIGGNGTGVAGVVGAVGKGVRLAAFFVSPFQI